MSKDLLIAGAGPMARAHADAARALGWVPFAVTRSDATASDFRAATKLAAYGGGLKEWLERNGSPEVAIVAVGVAALAETAIELMNGGCRRLLLEKPGGLDSEQIGRVSKAAETCGAEVVLGYNRRFYPSVAEARRIIEEDGGATSVRFDFTEFAERVGPGPQPPEVKAAWMLANSTHVIDLAFHLAGRPRTLHAVTDGALDWHPRAARFAGSGQTEFDAAFSYIADWEAPGRWSVDIRTRERRLLLEPMESLRVQRRPGFDLVEQTIPLTIPGQKEGVLEMLRAFLDGEGAHLLVPVASQARWAIDVYQPMLDGTDGVSRPFAAAS